MDPTDLADVFQRHEKELLRQDIRDYPSRKFKSGFNASFLQNYKDFLGSLFMLGRMMRQSEGEAAMDVLDQRLKGAVRFLAEKSEYHVYGVV